MGGRVSCQKILYSSKKAQRWFCSSSQQFAYVTIRLGRLLHCESLTYRTLVYTVSIGFEDETDAALAKRA